MTTDQMRKAAEDLRDDADRAVGAGNRAVNWDSVNVRRDRAAMYDIGAGIIDELTTIADALRILEERNREN